MLHHPPSPPLPHEGGESRSGILGAGAESHRRVLPSCTASLAIPDEGEVSWSGNAQSGAESLIKSSPPLWGRVREGGAPAVSNLRVSQDATS
jgi:hypothetical protein